VCDPAFVNRARAAARDHKSKGFSDPTLSGLFKFPEAVRTEYAIGAASLFRHPDPCRVRAMLGGEDRGASGEKSEAFSGSFIGAMQRRADRGQPSHARPSVAPKPAPTSHG